MTQQRWIKPRDDGQWEVDLREEGGEIVGPFATREAAITYLLDFWAEQE